MTNYSLKNFLRKNQFVLISVSVLFLLYFIPYLDNTHIALDTYVAINNPGTTYNWLDIGRQGGILLQKLFYFAPEFSMFYVQVMAYIAYVIAFFAFSYLFTCLASISVWKTGLFFLIFMIHPIWVEQFYFTLQIFIVAIGVLLIPVALYLSYQKKPIFWILGIVIQILAFSIYQTFTIVYIAGCILCFALVYISNIRKNLECYKLQFIKLGIRQAVQFVIAYGINSFITSQFFMGSDYLTDQIAWGNMSMQDCINQILAHIKLIISGEGVFYCYTFSASIILVVISVIYFLNQNKHAQESVFFVLALIVLQLTPFMLTLYVGRAPVFRSQYILPFATACNVLLFSVIMAGVKFEKAVVVNTFKVCSLLLFAHMLLSQYYTASQLQYTYEIVRQEDERRAFAIEERIAQESDPVGKPVAFIGYDTARENGAFKDGEIINYSVFQFGYWGEPRYRETTNWIVEYIKSLGISVRAASTEQIIEARDIAQDMPVFPLEGSVKDVGEYVIVKLSPDDYYASELMTPQVKVEMKTLTINSDERLNGYVDWVNIEDNILSVFGWVFQPYCDSNYVLPGVCLYDESNGMMYTMASGTQYRPDVTETINHNTDYDHSGVFAKAQIDQLPDNMMDCKILLSLTTKEETLYFDTGKLIKDYIG